MKKKKKLVVFLALSTLIALTAVTLAFFTAKDSVTNKFTIGNLTIKVDEPGWKDKDSWTGEKVQKIARVTNTDTFPAIIRVAVEPRWEDPNGGFFGGNISLLNIEYSNITKDYTTTNSWYDGGDGYYYYTTIVQPGEATEDIIKSIEFNVPEDQKDKYDEKKLKAVVRAEAVFPKAGTFADSWSGLHDDVKKMLTDLSK